MAEGKSDTHVEQPGPAEFQDPLIRREFQRAWVWIGSLLMVAAVILLSQPLLLIVGGLVFAVLLDGGTRLLGRYLPLSRGLRLAIVALLGFGFLGWVLWYAGTTFAAQFEALRLTVEAQVMRAYAWAADHGLVPEGSSDTVVQQLLGSLGRGDQRGRLSHRCADQRLSDPDYRHLLRGRTQGL